MRAGARDTLRRYVESHRELLHDTSYADLARSQQSQFATLAHGGGGTAYALWRLEDSVAARQWSKACLRDRRPSAYSSSTYDIPNSSYLHGRAGVAWVTALVGGPERADAIASYCRYAAGAGSLEFADGQAGHLTGARLLLRRFEDRHVRQIAQTLARSLCDRLRVRARKRWRPIDASGFAHYWPGVAYAMLAWEQFTEGAPSGWLVDLLRQLLAAWSPDVVRRAGLAASWCNGSAGMALLWAKAYETSSDRRFLAAARAAAVYAARAMNVGPDVCCGTAGLAFVMLTLDRIDRDSRWRDRATGLALRAIADSAGWSPCGLYRGQSGLMCLALDLLADVPAGFPGIEA